ncbi:T9SS type A sorting domain-containing protein [bacterium]|nr:T9SS type A sorting domain-containing protein [bacterium]
MSKTFQLFTVALLILAGKASAQPDSLWSRTYGGEGSQYCGAMIITQDGGFALGGETDNEECDIFLVVTDDQGQEIWSDSYDLGGWDYCTDIVQTDDSGFVLGGITGSDGGSSYCLLRTNTEGEAIWSNTFSSGYYNECYALEKTDDGGFIIAGSSINSDFNQANFYAVKVDSSGEAVWEHTYNYNNQQYCMDMTPADNGHFLIVGYSVNDNAGTNNAFLLEIDQDGRALSTHILESDSWDLCTAVARANGGGYALAGYSYDNGRYDLFLIRINENAELIWREDYSKAGDETCNALIRTSEGGYAIAGSAGADYNSGNFYVLRVGEDGQGLWELNYGGREMDNCFEIRATESGGYALAGYTCSFGEGGADAWLIVTDTDPVNVPNNPENLLPDEISLAPAYPNPFNSTTTISYGLDRPARTRIAVYDLSGREVTTLFDGYRQAGFHSVNLNANDLASGLYFVQLKASNQISTQKVILIR